MHEKSTPFLKIKYRIVGLAMINDCGQFQICNIDDRCIILEIVKFLHFYFYLQYTSDQQGLHMGRCVGRDDRPGGGREVATGAPGVGVAWRGVDTGHQADMRSNTAVLIIQPWRKHCSREEI